MLGFGDNERYVFWGLSENLIVIKIDFSKRRKIVKDVE